jgi:flagellar biosynthesis protein FliQ
LTEQLAMQFVREAITLTLMLAAPALGFALVVGLVVSILQAVTQINEVTLSFVPKIVAVFASLVIFGPWMLNTMLGYTARLLSFLPSLSH